jgi:hypothetical protein
MHVLADARLISWVPRSLQSFPRLALATFEPCSTPGMQDDYRTALRRLSRLPTVHTLELNLNGWTPWGAWDFAAATAPERALPQVTKLSLTCQFNFPFGL